MNTKKWVNIVCFIAPSDLHQPHHDPPNRHPAISLHDDRDTATLRYRPASRAQRPEQSRELTPECESYVKINVRTWIRHTYTHQSARRCDDRSVVHMNAKTLLQNYDRVIHDKNSSCETFSKVRWDWSLRCIQNWCSSNTINHPSDNTAALRQMWCNSPLIPSWRYHAAAVITLVGSDWLGTTKLKKAK